jgi:hypothetical protein
MNLTDATAANQTLRLSANPDAGSRRHPKRLSSIKPFLVKSTLVAQDVKRSACQLVGQARDIGSHLKY